MNPENRNVVEAELGLAPAKAKRALAICELASLHRGRRADHVHKGVIGTQESRQSPSDGRGGGAKQGMTGVWCIAGGSRIAS